MNAPAPSLRRPTVRSMFREMTLLALVVMVLQFLALWLFHDSLRQDELSDTTLYPLITHEVYSLPPGADLLHSGNYLALDGLETIQLVEVEGGIDLLVLDSDLTPVQQIVLPANVPAASIGAIDFDKDMRLDLVYTREWPTADPANGLDSLWLCARSLSGEEIVLDRRSAPSNASGWSASYSLPTSPEGPSTAAGINRLAVYHTTSNRSQRHHSLLLFTKEATPVLVAEVPLANLPGHGFWRQNQRGEEVFVVGGSPQDDETLIPIRILAADGGTQSTVLSGQRATLMQVSENGDIRWVRSFPPAPGEVFAYPTHGDTLFVIHEREAMSSGSAPSVSLFLLSTGDGTILHFRTHESLQFTRFVHTQSHRNAPIGLVYHLDSLYFLQHTALWETNPFGPPFETWQPIPQAMLWFEGEEWLLPVQQGPDTLVFFDRRSNIRAFLPGFNLDQNMRGYPVGDDVRPLLRVRDRQHALHLVELIPNPDPFWRIRPYDWLIVLLLLPHFLLFVLYLSLRIRQARRDARSRLIHAYRRLRERFRQRSEELAETNQKLEIESVERRRMYTELSNQREHLDSIFNSVLDGLVTLDHDGIITRANRSFGELFGLDPEATPGTPLVSLFPEQHDVLAQIIASPSQAGSDTTETQVELALATQGERKVVRIRLIPLHRQNSLPGETLVIFRDETRLVRLEDLMQSRYRFHNLIGQSERMRQIYSMIETIAPSDATVLITGESGTGKELVARALHHQSHRSAGPFVSVHCAALTETLLESELFGHVKGSFTGAVRDKVGYFQKAHRGTLLLDEFGEVSLSVQVKLLRVLNDKVFERVGDTTPIPVDVRILIATNRNLPEEVRAGRFREDLFYRINVLAIEMPSLRERSEDIPLLVTDLLQSISEQAGKQVLEISEDVLSSFMSYPWPGNIRELRNCLERAVIVSRDQSIRMEHLPTEIRDYKPGDNGTTLSPHTHQPFDLSPSEPDLASNERSRIFAALQKHGWVIARAARELSMARQTLYRKIADYQIERPD